MQDAIDETNRRREKQLAYNDEHGITPETIRKAIRRGIEEEISARRIEREATGTEDEAAYVTQEYLNELEAEMLAAAENLEFERAADLRDKILRAKSASGGRQSPDTPGASHPSPPPAAKAPANEASPAAARRAAARRDACRARSARSRDRTIRRVAGCHCRLVRQCRWVIGCSLLDEPAVAPGAHRSAARSTAIPPPTGVIR